MSRGPKGVSGSLECQEKWMDDFICGLQASVLGKIKREIRFSVTDDIRWR